MATRCSVEIGCSSDIVLARQRARELAERAGFTSTDLTLIATAISELARNIVLYAESGEITVEVAAGGRREGGRRGIVVIARDEGPGIACVEEAVQEGFSTSGGLGLGLPGVKRLVDEFEIHSTLGKGTKVRIAKWLPNGQP